jgi:hypothetical protein
MALTAALFTAHGAWAACTADIDMQGGKVLNVAVTDAGHQSVSEAATLAYLQQIMDDRSRGNMLSHATQKDLTWGEALNFCANLVSTAASDDAAEASQRLYNDWRLPTLDEWLASCHAQGSEAKVNLEETGEWYKENKVHPRRTWVPAGACKLENDADALWWINRHSAETVAGEDMLYHGAEPTDIRDARTTHVDPLHHAYAPEPEGMVRNVVNGYPEAWNPTSAAIQKIEGNAKLSVRCVR